MICCCVLVTMRTVAECVCGVGRLILDGKVVVGTFALSFVRCGRFLWAPSLFVLVDFGSLLLRLVP